jgi:hypothetical protein
MKTYLPTWTFSNENLLVKPGWKQTSLCKNVSSVFAPSVSAAVGSRLVAMVMAAVRGCGWRRVSALSVAS